MAWIDDRIWCHPKFAAASKPARWSYVAAIAYSTGFRTKGVLTDEQLKLIGATAKERAELVSSGLWHELSNGISINDWHEHNSKRDAKRDSDRDRKRRQRAKERENVTDMSRVTSSVTSSVTAQAEGSEGSETKDFALEVESAGAQFAASVVTDTRRREHRPYDPPTDPMSSVRALFGRTIHDEVDLDAELRAHSLQPSEHERAQLVAELRVWNAVPSLSEQLR